MLEAQADRVSTAHRHVVCRLHWPSRALRTPQRAAARDLINAGVPEKVVCQIVGWKPGSQMLTRYHIVNEGDVAQALAKRFTGANVTPAAQNSAPASSPAA